MPIPLALHLTGCSFDRFGVSITIRGLPRVNPAVETPKWLTCDLLVTYRPWRGSGVQGAGRPDAQELAGRALPPGRADAEQSGGALRDDPIRGEQAPQAARG